MKQTYEYTGVRLPRSTKKKVRSVAADLETSIGQAALYLIEIGLREYESNPGTIGDGEAQA